MLACADDPVADGSDPPADAAAPVLDAAPLPDARPGDDAAAPDAATSDAAVVGAACPPVGPFGTAEGDVAADVVLYDCDDQEVRLHSLCDAEAGWIVEYAEWCPVCRTFARDEVESLWQTYSPLGVRGYVVVSADASYGAPTAELCREVQARYDFTIPVLYDPTGALQSGLDVASNAVNVLFTEGMRIAWKGRYEDEEVEGRLAGLVD